MRSIIVLSLVMAISVSSDGQNLIEGTPKDGELVYYCPPCGCPHDGKYFSEMGVCPSCNMQLRPTIVGLEPQFGNTIVPTVGLLLFNNADVMDVSGPLSVFEHAGFNVATFAKTKDPVRIGRNLEIKPDFTVETLPPVDILVFPGGGLAENNPADTLIVNFIQKRFDSTAVLFSVCSGAFFLGEAGVLKGQSATTFASMIPLLKNQFPEAIVKNDVKYTDNGKVVTSAGLSSGIDAAFQVVSKYYGVGRAQDIANHMEYPWKREHDYARSQLADNYIQGIKNVIALFSIEYFYSQGDHNQWEYRYVLTKEMSAERILDVIRNELEKKKNWKKDLNTENRISGVIDHPVLGKAKVDISVESHFSKGKVAIVTVKRSKPFVLHQQ